MKIVIDIPDGYIADGCFLNNIQNGSIACGQILKAVKNGKPLLKEQGRLIVLSENKLKENQINLDFSFQKWISEVGVSLATIAVIEADNAESEDKK